MALFILQSRHLYYGNITVNVGQLQIPNSSCSPIERLIYDLVVGDRTYKISFGRLVYHSF